MTLSKTVFQNRADRFLNSLPTTSPRLFKTPTAPFQNQFFIFAKPERGAFQNQKGVFFKTRGGGPKLVDAGIPKGPGSQEAPPGPRALDSL